MFLRVYPRPLRVLFLGTVLSFAVLSCGKSPDELYSSGKEKILTEATFEEGKDLLETFIGKFPDDPRAPEVSLAIAAALQGHGRKDESERAFESIIERYPDTAEAYKALFLLAYLRCEDENDIESARDTLTRFIELYPDSELTVSARVMLDNLGRPTEEWPILQNLQDSADAEE